MTLKEAYQFGEQILLEHGIGDAHLDAWLLLEYVSKITRAMYYVKEERVLTEEEESAYRAYIGKRAAHIPIQHITGVQEFMGLEFQVNEHVLIPRQDTELLAEEALKVMKLHTDTGRTYRLLDMCTGSGCILLSLLHYADKYTKMSCEGTGADISEVALNTARSNAEQLQLTAEFLHSDLFQSVEGTYQMIVSNPPYIRTKEIEALQEEVKDHDPVLALDGKEDGLYFYRKIITEAARYLEHGGYLLFEIGFDQGTEVQSLMCQAGYQDVAVKKDLTGLDRVVIGVYDR